MGTCGGIIATIFKAFDRHGASSYGENVSQLEHALQCAQLARDHAYCDELVIAALLHDLGRMLVPEGNSREMQGIDAEHEHIGANWLARVFPPSVTEPIRLHVAAKRYLCATEPGYGDTLSAASQLSLIVQGGATAAGEIMAFERQPFFADAVRLRRLDDWGKRMGCPVADLQSYRPLLETLCMAPS